MTLGLRASNLFPQIALAIRVLTSRIGVKVPRCFGFVLGGRVSSEVLYDVCMTEGSHF